MAQYTGSLENQNMHEQSDPDYCPDNKHSHKHEWVRQSDLSGEFNTCEHCGVTES